MNPRLCGLGLGREFFKGALEFAKDNLSAKSFA